MSLKKLMGWQKGKSILELSLSTYMETPVSFSNYEILEL